MTKRVKVSFGLFYWENSKFVHRSRQRDFRGSRPHTQFLVALISFLACRAEFVCCEKRNVNLPEKKRGFF